MVAGIYILRWHLIITKGLDGTVMIPQCPNPEKLPLSLSFLTQTSRLRGVLDVCIEFVEAQLAVIDLLSGDLSNNVQAGCPSALCLATSGFTLTSQDSFIEFSVQQGVTSYFKLLLEFQTRCAYLALAVIPRALHG